MSSQIIVSRNKSRADEAINILIEGLKPLQKIKVQAESNDYYCINAMPDIGVGSLWHADAIFISDNVGRIDLSKDDAIAGCYTGISAMGLLYLMEPVCCVKNDKKPNIKDIPPYSSYHIKIAAFCDEKKICETEIQRYYLDACFQYSNVIGNRWVGRLFGSDDKKKLPAVIVLSGSDGRIEKAQNIAELISTYGFRALAVCYFGLEGSSSDLSKIPIEIIEEAVEYLNKKENVLTDKIALYGRSKGGELALLAASMIPSISCVIANTPSCYVMEGLNDKMRNSKTSSWSYNGKEIPYIQFKIRYFIQNFVKKILGKKHAMSEVYEKLLSDKEKNNAIIPVENIRGHVLLLSSEDDEVWPSSVMCKTAMNQIREADTKYKVLHKNYLFSGHHLTVAYQPNYRYKNEKWYRQMQDGVDSWKETIHFLCEWRESGI